MLFAGFREKSEAPEGKLRGFGRRRKRGLTTFLKDAGSLHFLTSLIARVIKLARVLSANKNTPKSCNGASSLAIFWSKS